MGFSARRFLALAAVTLLAVPGAARAADAPGAPGAIATWTEGDKDGIGPATGTSSPAWLTIDDGELTEVYAPDLGTPSIRDLQFVVSDGSTFAEREREDATHTVELADPRSLTYRQVNTARSGRWRITKTDVTDPDRAAVLVDVRFESLTGRPYQLYALLDPALSNAGDDDTGARRAATARLDAIAATASEGWMLPEQVWDDQPPAGRPGFAPGTGSLSATPLAWTHAQFMRLAWSIDAGRPVERPDVVACRYAKRCRP